MFRGTRKLVRENDPQIKPDKSDATFFGTVPGLKKAGLPSSVIAAGCSVNVSDSLRILGIILDSALTFENHDNDIVKACLCVLYGTFEDL